MYTYLDRTAGSGVCRVKPDWFAAFADRLLAARDAAEKGPL